MDKKFVIALNWDWAANTDRVDKLFNEKHLLPIGRSIGHLDVDCDISLKYRKGDNAIVIDDDAKLQLIKERYHVRSDRLFSDRLPDTFKGAKTLFLTVVGSNRRARIIIQPDLANKILNEIEEQDPTLRLVAHDLPPASATVIETGQIARPLIAALIEKDHELHSPQIESFLKSPHILISLFSFMMNISSQDQFTFISQIRCIADQLRELLSDKIKRVPKNHNELWYSVYGQRLAFVDGGMSRIVGLPGTEPMAIRVGIYSVVPGQDTAAREDWRLWSYLTGDVLSHKFALGSDGDIEPDSKRVQEAARYILELWSCLKYLRTGPPSDYLFLHGPLVNAFETYNEGRPYNIPGVNKSLLSLNDVDQKEVCSSLSDIPKDAAGNLMWNQCIPIYGYLLKKVFDTEVPIAGVVERSPSKNLSSAWINALHDASRITNSHRRKYLGIINKYQITDEFLFGCILEEGEYLDPIILPKNFENRAWDRWQPVVRQFPQPHATILKASSKRFPYRVETNFQNGPAFGKLMSILYHTSLLLPNYAFPVGLDIVDKYAKVPDWLSRGVSTALTAQVLFKTLQTGHPRLLEQVRQLLARSPRDFFFRPKP